MPLFWKIWLTSAVALTVSAMISSFFLDPFDERESIWSEIIVVWFFAQVGIVGVWGIVKVIILIWS